MPSLCDSSAVGLVGCSVRLLTAAGAVALAALIGTVTPEPAAAFECTNAGAVITVAAPDDGGVATNTACGDGAETGIGNSTSVGYESNTDNSNSTAVGAVAYAGANNSTAIGFGATVGVGHDSSTAIGVGAATTTNNQMVLGTANETYVMPGVTSALSRSRQTGPLEVVTSDANGNLATDGGAIYDSIAKNKDGAAIAMAMENPDLTGDEKFGLSFNYGNFDGASAISGAVMGVLWENAATRFAVSGGVGYGFESETFGGRVGGQLTW